MRPYGAWGSDDELEKALNRVPDEVSADFISEDDILGAGGGIPSTAEGAPHPGATADLEPLPPPMVQAVPPSQADPREALIRKAFAAQQAHDEGRSARLSEAARKDRQAQAQADTREYLRAAFTRHAPQLRNVGNSYSQEAAAVGNDGPLSRELALQKVLAGYEKKAERLADPLDQQIKKLSVALKEKELAAPPKTEKPTDYLTPAEQSSLESQLSMAAGMPIKLPRDEQGRTRKDFVGPLNSSANSMGMMASKADVAAKGRAQARSFHDDRNKEELQQMEIPGWSRDPAVRVDTAEVRQLRDADAEVADLAASIGRLQDAIRKNGVEINPRSPAFADMSAMLADVQLKSKGPAAYQLGVLAGPDVGFLQQMTGDPTSLKGLFKGPEDAVRRLDVAKGSAVSRLNAKMGSRGYSKGKKSGEDTQIRVREKSTGQTGVMLESEFDPAEYERL